MTKKTLSRTTLTVATTLIMAIVLLIAFWPKSTLVDIGTVTKGDIELTINEEAYTKVSDLYVLSTPFSGRLMRTNLQAGDAVIKGETVVAQLLPNPIGSKNTQWGQAKLKTASANVAVAQSALKQAKSDETLAQQQATRSKQQLSLGTISANEHDERQQAFIIARNNVVQAKALLVKSQAELALINGQLFSDEYSADETIDIVAPVSGAILRIIEDSEKVLPSGTAILSIGDIENDLEIIVELLSSDAVKVKLDQKVLITNWGSEQPLVGKIKKIEPLGFIKTSALGVEERRVKAIVDIVDKPDSAASLGHGFRVDVAITIWEKQQAVKVPSSALFRENSQWAVFVVSNGKTQLREVHIEQNNGTQASVVSGLEQGELVVLYPASSLVDGLSVSQR